MQNASNTPQFMNTAQGFFAVGELLSKSDLPRLYTDLLINSPTTLAASQERLELSENTTRSCATTLFEIGLAEQTEGEWTVSTVSGSWTIEATIEIGPVVIAAYGATNVDDDLGRYTDRHGRAALIPAVQATVDYLKGDLTRRGAAEKLGVSTVEGIAVTQAIEPIVAVVRDVDPLFRDVLFEVDVHERALDKAPYHVVN
ncbi:DUF7437 domain-containing protein [Halogeometricum luteum]|uniref:DUF7437 domain-containing protein n=1 Tax=Halogeometricum luteum TaxID=2950537 RepID=A0ABU2G6X5_9EURY|nr:hypothetical protein [Halogeometricum sp. S3BR5-2]MDS0296545.1 hypothetical protein [Halogeometricum sp. S3BR5-2]